MKTIMLALLIGFLGLSSKAQVTNVSLQAAGLTCSLCSKAVLSALQKVSFVDKVMVDIKNQQYHISFKENTEIDFDALEKAVEDAGFSVANFKVTANLSAMKIQKDEHVLIGNQWFHFLNVSQQEINGNTSFTIVDKKFTSAKNFKKYSALSNLECVKTGHIASCCAKENRPLNTRVYHAII